ncbi:MAG: IS5 family transposase [Chlorobiales bacterium]|nr:IS5 family transposase [Chlorobiales bacterium]
MQTYPSDLTDSQWEDIKELGTSDFDYKRKRKYSLRHVCNAIFYVLKTGCQWRYLPKAYGKWQSIYYYFDGWRQSRLWVKLTDRLREKVRRSAGKSVSPTAICVDSQSVETTARGGLKGYDKFKNVKGRKRHILTDTAGLLVAARVIAASTHESQDLLSLLQKIRGKFGYLDIVFADGGYRGFEELVKAGFGFRLQVTLRGDIKKGFIPLPKRWVIERTFAWFGLYRRLGKDYEFNTLTSETMIYIAMAKLMLNRLHA